MDDTTLFRVVLYLLVVFTEQLFAALVSSGGNRRLPLAALNNRDFVVWTRHFVSLLSLIGGWGWRFTTSFWAEKKQETFFQISCSVCHCVSGGYLVVKVRDKLTRCKANKLELHQNNLRQQRCPTCDFFLYCGNSFLNGISGRIYNIRFIYSQIAKLLPHGFYQFDICLSV